MVVSVVSLTTGMAEKVRPDSLEITVIDQGRPRERHRSPTRRRGH